jgi:hypothetical protein
MSRRVQRPIDPQGPQGQNEPADQQAAAQQNAAAQQAAQAVAQLGAPIRARNPAQWGQNVELDYGTKQDRDYYKQAVEKLEGDLYDGKNLPVFLKKVEGKAYQFGWLNLLSYTYQGNPPVTKNMLQHYGEITMTDVRQKTLTYLGLCNRNDQDSDMLYNCLRKSISDGMFAKISKEVSKYRYDINGESLFDGPSYLMTIIDLTYVNTKANITAARDNLSSLSEYMDSLPDSNVETFNDYVKEQLETLDAGGENTTELVTNLFKGYARAKDDTFRDWVRIKKMEYNDGTYHINPNGIDFMNAARKHYKDLLLSKEWMKMDDKQQSILALQSEIEQVKAQATRMKRKGEARNKQSRSNEWAWKKIPPRPGEPRTKKFKGKTYYWCTNHQLWCLHKPSECKLKGEDTKKDGKRSGKETLKMRVYQSLFNTSSEEEEENEEEEAEEESEDNESDEESNTSN